MRSPIFLRSLPLLFFVYVAHSRTLAATQVSSQELSQLLAPYTQIQKISADFNQKKFLKDLKIELLSNGSMTFERPQNIRWTIHKPSPLEVAIDNDKISLTTQNGDAPVVIPFSQIGKNQNTSGLSLMIPWLAGDAEQILKSFEVTKEGDQLFSLVPRTSGSLFRLIQIKTASAKGKNPGWIESLTLNETSGDAIEIRFKAVKIAKTR